MLLIYCSGYIIQIWNYQNHFPEFLGIWVLGMPPVISSQIKHKKNTEPATTPRKPSWYDRINTAIGEGQSAWKKTILEEIVDPKPPVDTNKDPNSGRQK